MNTPESNFGRRGFLRTTGIACCGLGFNLRHCLADALRPGPTTAKAAIMPGAEIIVGLDIGTSKVRVAVGERQSDGAIKILGVGQARSLGVRCGEIVDSEAASKCVMKAFVDAEEKTDVMIGTTHLAVFNKISAYGSSTTARKKINCVHGLGLEIANLAHIPFSSALAVLNPDQKKLGALVIDLGAGTTSYIALAGDRVQHWAIRVVGGDHITNDLSLGLRIPMARAERLKIEEGSVRLGRSMHGERIMVTDEHGFSAREVKREVLNTIIHCQVRDTFDRMKAHLETNGVYLDSLAAGVHLTGGGSMLRGIDDLAQEVFGIPVHRARAKGIIWAATALESPRYSRAVGLLKPGADYTRIANLRGYRSGWADADDVC